MNATAEYELSFQLSAGAVDATSGLIRAATVAQAGVVAIGKYVMLDKDGQLTRDPEKMKRKVKVVTDSETLTSLMAAAAAAGGALKVRSDHDDSLEARAGYADNFKLIPEADEEGKKIPARVVADIHLNDSYRDRAIVIETAKKTPNLIGLSIDPIPSFDIVKDQAFMRVDELLAVDIVDSGAITHGGLFLSRGVDKIPKVKTHNSDPAHHMADKSEKTEPTLAECMSAINKLTEMVGEAVKSHGELAKSHAALAEKVGKLGEPPAKKGDDADNDGMKAVTDQLTKLSVKFDELQAGIVDARKTGASLGMKSGDAKGGTHGDGQRAGDKGTDINLEKATYHELVDDMVAKSGFKMKRSDAHETVQAAHPDKYRAYLEGRGIYDVKKDPHAAQRSQR